MEQHRSVNVSLCKHVSAASNKLEGNLVKGMLNVWLSTYYIGPLYTLAWHGAVWEMFCMDMHTDPYREAV